MKYLKGILRWGVAAAGAWYVLSQLTWNDRALVIVDGSNVPVWENVVAGSEDSAVLQVQAGREGAVMTVAHDAVPSEPDKKGLTTVVDGRAMAVVGIDLLDMRRARRVLVMTGPGQAQWVDADKTDYQVNLPHPRVQEGVRHLLASAQRWYLCAAIFIFPLTFIITAFRWHELLKAVGIVLPASRTFILNMVGAFYNTFMPGSTGGDVLKAYYVAKQTHHRTRAVMSVVVDRMIGLLALIILGGAMAAFASWHWQIRQTRGVAAFSGVIILGTAAGLLVFYDLRLRKLSGLDWIIRRLPMQARVEKAIEAMQLYGQRPGLAAAALVASFPVHAIVVMSAYFAGCAFSLHIPWYFYWTVVPVSVLAGSIPISPQGAGVMEYFAILLLTPLGCTVAEAVVLTMSIRLVQVLWNLTGGILVLRGGYHAPTTAEAREVEEEDEDRV